MNAPSSISKPRRLLAHPQLLQTASTYLSNSPLLTKYHSGYIPVNKDNGRLDISFLPPTSAEWIIYNARFHAQKPCNSFQLHGVCTSFNCPFDHKALEPEAHHCLKYVLKCSPCPRKGTCRLADCHYGHICQKNGCEGQLKGCKMKADLHHVDPTLASLVPAEEEALEHQDPSWY